MICVAKLLSVIQFVFHIFELSYYLVPNAYRMVSFYNEFHSEATEVSTEMYSYSRWTYFI